VDRAPGELSADSRQPSVPTAAVGRETVRRTVVAAALSTVLGTLPVFLLSGLAVLAGDDLGFGATGLGLAVSAFFVVSALTSLPAAWLAGRIGARAATLLATVVSVAGLAGLSMAPSYGVVLTAMVVAGTGNSLAQIASNDALARVVPVGRQGLAFGIKQSAVPAATLVAGLALPVIALTLGWRASLAGAGLLGVLYLGAYFRLVRRPPCRSAGRSGNGRPRCDSPLRVLVAVAVAAGLASAAANSFGAFLVAATVADGLSPSLAGFLLAGGSALGVGARVYVGVRADWRRDGHLLVVSAMMVAGAGGLGLVASGPGPVVVLGVALVFGAGWAWSGLLNYALVRLNPSAPARASSFAQAGVFAGGAVGPLCFGLAVEAWSYRAAWLAAAVAMLCGGLAMSLGRRLAGDVR
jgi:predicted MFS family arabinose efflux permease